MKLDRLLARHHSMGRKAARRAILEGRVTIDGRTATRVDEEVSRFDHVSVAGETVSAGLKRLHLMLHKPVGILSATADAEHPTVIDLIDHPDKHTLHLAGRLDRGTSGLVLLTNDGRWSKALMTPDAKVAKVYRVETRDPIPPSAVEAFERGFHFHTENLITRPAILEILDERSARLTLHEGRYHQIKRMFHRTGNRVTALHRERIGGLEMPRDLAPGEWRELDPAEVSASLA